MNLICRTPTHWLSNFSQCLWEWQTIVGSILALFAAAGTIIYLKEQILQQEKIEKQKLDRKHLSYRVTLTLTLSQICKVTSEAIETLARLRSLSLEDRNLSKIDRSSLFSINSQEIKSLQGIIETTENIVLVSLIFRICRDIQVTSARIEVMHIWNNDLEETIESLAEIYTLSESLFPYARKEIDECPTEILSSRVESIICSELRAFRGWTIRKYYRTTFSEERLWLFDEND